MKASDSVIEMKVLVDFLKKSIDRYCHTMSVLEENNCDHAVWADMHGRVEALKEVLRFIGEHEDESE